MPSDLIRGWTPVRIKKTRQNKNLEPGSDSIRNDKALVAFQRTMISRNQRPPVAPVSHQKRPRQGRTNANDFKPKLNKINENDHYPPAHNGLVAGSSPAGPTISMIRQRSQPSAIVR
jgi:hypothetical protein